MCVGVSSYEQGGRGEGEAGVLHAPVGERGWQHQDVVLAPHVRPHQILRRLQHALRLRGRDMCGHTGSGTRAIPTDRKWRHWGGGTWKNSPRKTQKPPCRRTPSQTTRETWAQSLWGSDLI